LRTILIVTIILVGSWSACEILDLHPTPRTSPAANFERKAISQKIRSSFTQPEKNKHSKSISALYQRMANDLKKGLPLVMTVHVALCDNKSQGIVPVPAKLGNGEDSANNLYWGAMYGFQGEFRRSSDWKKVYSRKLNTDLLEVTVFSKTVKPELFWKKLGVQKSFSIYLIGKAYRGKKIRTAVVDFIRTTFQDKGDKLKISDAVTLNGGGQSHILGFIGHNYLMDIPAKDYPFAKTKRNQSLHKGIFILACKSHTYFAGPMLNFRTHNLATTKTLMAPECYTLRYLTDALLQGANHNTLQQACAKAYSKYQKISLTRASSVFRSGN